MKTNIASAILVAFLTAFLTTVTQPAVAMTTLLNDDFGAPSYTLFEFNGADSGSNLDDLSFATSSATGSGGNPGGFLDIMHTHDVDRDSFGDPVNGDGSASVQSFSEEQSVVYDATASGTIAEIMFELDVLVGPIGPEGGAFHTVFFIVHEASGGGSASGFTSLSGLGSGWNTITVSGLTNADFSARDFQNGTDLQFGFGFSSSGDVSNGGETITVSVDNFIVTANVIPEPSSLLLGTLMTVGMLMRRRRL